MYTSAYYLCIL